RRRLPDFGLGPGPDTHDRAGAELAAALPVLDREADEADASLLGILWEAGLGQPALASFLDQNWLEGLERSAAAHFAAVLGRLRAQRLISQIPGISDKVKAGGDRGADRARAAIADCGFGIVDERRHHAGPVST